MDERDLCRCGCYPNIAAAVRYVAGGTDLLNLMKDGVEDHHTLVDINSCRSTRPASTATGSAHSPG